MNHSAFPPPVTLLTATLADGQRLARQLADTLLASLPNQSGEMPDFLRTAHARPSPEIVTAIYFHAISQANNGWNQRANPPATG